MSRKRRNNEIGYRKPPKHTQFKKGQSGNPGGRPKGTRNFKTDLREELDAPVSVREGESVQTMSSQRAAIKRLRAKALEGDPRSLDRLLELAERHAVEDAEDTAETALASEDEAIIERFAQRLLEERDAKPDPEQVKDNEETDDE